MSNQNPIRFYHLEEVSLPDRPLHLAVGMFDGVHLGHQAVIETATQSAHASTGVCGVLTFWPHPSRLFNPSDPVMMIMPPDIKAGALGGHDVDYIIEQPFDMGFASIEAIDLVAYLKRCLPSLSSIHVGSNWRFGSKRLGDIPMLVELGRKAGVHVIHVERVNYDGEPISSTRIRKHLTVGEMEEANALLGDIYFSVAEAEGGKQLGTKMGFPTLNLPWSAELKPPFGVYCVEVEGLVGGVVVRKKGVANFGVRPTVEVTDIPVLEVHLLEDCPFTTGDPLKVRWYKFLRSEMKFDGVESLKMQINKDVRSARSYWKL